jgi:hypothetical protein
MFNQFQNKFPLEEIKWVEYTNYFNRLEVPTKTILLEEGEISKSFLLLKVLRLEK